MITFFISHYTKSNLTNTLRNFKDKVINKVRSPTGTPADDINNIFVKPPMATK